MRHSLKPHPDAPPCPVTAIDVEVARPHAGSLRLTYAVSGRIADVRMPTATAPARADLLWQHTCLEAFIGVPGGPYYEFNFSPSTRWQAARFDAYRAGQRIADEVAPVSIELHPGRERFTVQAAWSVDRPGELGRRTW